MTQDHETMPQDYTITAVNRAFDDADKHGNVTWNVKIDGETETALLKTRPENKPKEGDVIFGHFEPTQSKKATWLKKDLREGGGNFQNSRPAAPSANSSPPSSNGYADRDKSIRDAVIYKEAAAFLRANPQAGMAKCVRTARALMEIVECADIPQDTPAPESLSQVAADSEIPF